MFIVDGYSLLLMIMTFYPSIEEKLQLFTLQHFFIHICGQ